MHNEAIVTGVGGNIVSIKAPSGAIIKNEVANICVGEARLKSEVLRVHGKNGGHPGFRRNRWRQSRRSRRANGAALIDRSGAGAPGKYLRRVADTTLSNGRGIWLLPAAGRPKSNRLIESNNGDFNRRAPQVTRCLPEAFSGPFRSAKPFTKSWYRSTYRDLSRS